VRLCPFRTGARALLHSLVISMAQQRDAEESLLQLMQGFVIPKEG
jgi:hypothetical protein